MSIACNVISTVSSTSYFFKHETVMQLSNVFMKKLFTVCSGARKQTFALVLMSQRNCLYCGLNGFLLWLLTRCGLPSGVDSLGWTFTGVGHFRAVVDV